ncbi:MAG: Hpt domain-containing protein [Pirellula sp.]
MSHDPNEMMLELFRAEVESHADALTSALLKLEQAPSATGLIDGMMRAAHSIKGAARIVRINPAVEIAHVMEDCFVAAQRGQLVLEPSGIDVMLRSVDLLSEVSDASRDSNVDWTSFQLTVDLAVAQLRCVLNGQPIDRLSLSTPEQESRQTVVGEANAKLTNTSSNAFPDPTRQGNSIPFPVTSPSMASPGHAPQGLERIMLPEYLNGVTAEPIRSMLLHSIESQSASQAIHLDFSALQDLDAIGLAFLHSASSFANSHQRTMIFHNIDDELAGILNTVGILNAEGRE